MHLKFMKDQLDFLIWLQNVKKCIKEFICMENVKHLERETADRTVWEEINLQSKIISFMEH